MAEHKIKKSKREIPLRPPGEVVNSQVTRPSQILFSEVLRAEQNLDDQDNNILDDQIPKFLDDQNNNILDDQISNYSDDQDNILGRPKKKTLVDKTTKKEIWTTKKIKNLDDQTTKKKTLDDQKNKKTGNWKKYENARSTSRIGLRPNAEILRKIRHYCVEKGMDVTEFFEIAALHFMNLVDQTGEGLVDKTPYDDRRLMMTFKTQPRIINLYLRYNSIFNPSSKWKPRDDESAWQFNDLSITIIELGIIQAQINKYQSDPTGSINSFKYYKQEIENFARLGLDEKTLETILEINRQNWEKITGKSLPKEKGTQT